MYAPLLLNRQFLLAGRTPDLPATWEHVRFGNLILATSTALPKAISHDRSTAIACLGDIYDPWTPSADNQNVVSDIAGTARSFGVLEALLRNLSGRYVIIATIDGQTRLYNDATGLRSIFYFVGQHEYAPCIGSQPGLLAQTFGLAFDKDLQASFSRASNASTWVGELSPVKGVRRLLPNHYLDVDSGRAIRYWPTNDLAEMSPSEGARRVGDILERTIEAYSARYELAIGLSGGLDSRVLFSASRRFHDRVSFFSFDHPATEAPDLKIPAKILRSHKVNHWWLKATKTDHQLLETCDYNTAKMFLDPARRLLSTLNDLPRALAIAPDKILLVSGSVSEVGRCFYDKFVPQRTPESSFEQRFLALSGLDNNPWAQAELRRWHGEIGNPHGIDFWDILYWEQRLGAWASPAFLAFDTFTNIDTPFNNRSLLETMLSVPRKFREAPHELHRQIIRNYLPGIVDLPVNRTTLSVLNDVYRRVVPWPMQRAVKQIMRPYHDWMMRRAGLDPVIDA